MLRSLSNIYVKSFMSSLRCSKDR